MSSAEVFNRLGFSRSINSSAGRVFRLVVGIGLLIVGYLFRDNTSGVITMMFSVLPLSAGAFGHCYVSAIFGRLEYVLWL